MTAWRGRAGGMRRRRVRPVAFAADGGSRSQRGVSRAECLPVPYRTVPYRSAAQRSAAGARCMCSGRCAAFPSALADFARGVVCDGATVLVRQGCNTANLRCNLCCNLRCNLRCNLGPRSGRRDARPAPVRRARARAACRAQGRRDAGKSHCIAPHRTASHRIAPHRTASHRITSLQRWQQRGAALGWGGPAVSLGGLRGGGGKGGALLPNRAESAESARVPMTTFRAIRFVADSIERRSDSVSLSAVAEEAPQRNAICHIRGLR